MRNGNGESGESLAPLLRRWSAVALPLAFLGGVAALVGLFVDPQQFFQAFLFGYMFWAGFSLGCLSLTLLHHIIRASWSLTVLRILEAGTKTLPLMAVLFALVIIPGMLLGHIYPWAGHRADEPGIQHALDLKGGYLNPIFFIVRYFLYFAFWIGISRFLNRSSLQQDRTGDETLAQARTNWSAPGLVLHIILTTFAITDWVMSLDPHWTSTVFGVLFLAGQELTALSFTVILVVRFSERRPFSEIVNPTLTRDLGNMMLASTMFWTYLSLSQFLIMWSANLPEETPYYVIRNSGGWLWVGVANILFGFFAPFLMLLSGRTKRTPAYLWRVAGLILFMRLVDTAWIILPFYRQAGWGEERHLLWMSVAALLAVGGIWLTAFAAHLRRSPLLARHDPRLREALEHA